MQNIVDQRNHSTLKFMLIIGALLIVPVAGALWFGLVSVEPLTPDEFWHNLVIAPTGTIAFSVAYVFHFIGSTKAMAVVTVIILIVTILFRKWSFGLTAATSMFTVLVATKLIKMVVDRPRPFDVLVAETETSFPSGHVLGAAAIATVLVCFAFASAKVNKTGEGVAVILGAGYVVAMMWSRTALHVHWLSDTVAAAFLGTAIALTFSYIFLFRKNLDNSLTSPTEVVEGKEARGRHAL